jgi:hypothetical protein
MLIRECFRLRTGLLLATLAALAVAGCGSETITVVQSTPAPTPSSAPNAASSTIRLAGASSPTTCTVYLSGNDAQVTFASADLQVDPECQDLITAAAKGGSLWSEDPSTSSSDGASEPPVCSLVDPKSQVTATISDTGGAIFSTPICTALISSGWTEQDSDAGTITDPNTPAEDTGSYCDPRGLHCTTQGSTVTGSPGAGQPCVLDDGAAGTMEITQAVCERP